ncbi:MAG: methyltransferase [Polyangiaceae bacterium]|nr:methyltransferase [Polyangiaceae bacterium]
MPTAEERAGFIREHTELAPVPLVPELRLHLATEVTELWEATEAWLRAHDLPPPFWAFAWAGGQALARCLIDRPELVRGRRVLDFGAGSGLVAIAALRAGATSAVATDIDDFALAACTLNAAANGVALATDARDVSDASLDDIDVVLVGDMFYERTPSARFEPWLRTLAAAGKTVLAGEPGRAFAPAGLALEASYEVPTSLDLEGRTSRTGRVWRVPG